MKTKFISFFRLYAQSTTEFFKASPLYASILFLLIPLQSVLPAAIIASSQSLLTDITGNKTFSGALSVWGVSVMLVGIFNPIVTLTQGLLTD